MNLVIKVLCLKLEWDKSKPFLLSLADALSLEWQVQVADQAADCSSAELVFNGNNKWQIKKGNAEIWCNSLISLSSQVNFIQFL